MSQFVYIPESDIWTDKVRMVQTKDPVLGGKDGPANWAAQDLTNRTLFLKKAVEAAQTSANTANTAAKNADTKAGTAQTTANQAKTAAATAQLTADDAKSAAATADGKAVAAQTSANTASTAAKNADTKAANAQTTANQAKTAAANAQKTADDAKSAAATADAKAVAAQNSANAASTAAKNADTKAANAQKTADEKMAVGAYGIGSYGITSTIFDDFYAFPTDNFELTQFPIQTGFYTLSREMKNGWKSNGQSAIYTGQLEVQIRAYRAGDEIILKAWEGGICYINIRQTGVWTGWFQNLNQKIHSQIKVVF